MKFDKTKSVKKILLIFLVVFLAQTLPLVKSRPYGGERIGFTAGMIRLYCQDAKLGFLKSPQIHFGRNSFNLELPIFEWVQGHIARAIDGPECDSVEPVAKTVSILFGALAILAASLLAGALWGPWASLITAAFMAFDSLWLRYSTMTMIEERVLACGVLAVFFSVRRRAFLAGLFWLLTFTQKPQFFIFLASFWLGTEGFVLKTKLREFLQKSAIRNVVLGFICASVLSVIYFALSQRLNRASDLPWIQHMGPRAVKWYFGDWTERFTFVYYKNQMLDWLRRSSVVVVAPMLVLVFWGTKQLRSKCLECICAGLPFLLALFAYTFVFYHVYVVHEYYALPLHIAMAITSGWVLSLLVNYRATATSALAILCCAVVAGDIGIRWKEGISQHLAFVRDLRDPSSKSIIQDWNHQVFPKKNVFVAMAVDGSGRDLFWLYLTKQHGFVWCAKNEKFAPRRYWKEQGVQYVAWDRGYNPTTGRRTWLVRTMEEELQIARKNGWSSDIHDFWSSKTMAEWANLGSTLGKDPCIAERDFDPRTWL